MLKIGFPDEESEHEHLVLQRWGGRGAVRLLAAEPRHRGLLLERLHATDLNAVDNDDACRIVADLYRRIHLPALPHLRSLSTAIDRWTAELGPLPRNAPIPRRLVEQAIALGTELAADHGVKVHYESADLTRSAEIDAMMARISAAHGGVDILVNNAGITSPERLLEVSDALYDRIMDVNMRGSFHMTQAVVPAMRAQKAGSIVNMASVSAQRGGGVFGGTPYAAAKGAILGYTKACARELGPDNVRVNAICPSLIDTDITAGKMSCERRREILAGIPMGRVGSARDVAGCCLFLASDLSAYVTGSEVDVNGGSHIH